MVFGYVVFDTGNDFTVVVVDLAVESLPFLLMMLSLSRLLIVSCGWVVVSGSLLVLGLAGSGTEVVAVGVELLFFLRMAGWFTAWVDFLVFFFCAEELSGQVADLQLVSTMIIGSLVLVVVTDMLACL